MNTPRTIAILGFDREGRASYDYFSVLGDTVTICDKNTDVDIPDGTASVLGNEYLDNLDRFDVLVRTPGMRPSLILDKNPGVAAKITSGTNEFFKACPTPNIIGVTGTKGKGTTSTLIANMLEASGKTVHLAGNIGVAALSLLSNISSEDWVVLELSSFQLADCKASPHIAVCLMMAEEHIDTHGSFEAYMTAKEQLFAHQLPGDVAIYYYPNIYSKKVASAGAGQKVPYYHSPGAEIVEDQVVIDGHTLCMTAELKLLGTHNWQNVCAAVTAVWYAAHSGVGPETEPDFAAMRRVLTSFTGLPFRIELRRTVNNIRYYNDSFASAPPTTIAAMRSIVAPKVMIIGGFDRNLDVSELVNAVIADADSVRKLLLIGAAKARVAQALEGAGFSNFVMSNATNMNGIVHEATSLAQSGDAVVLSPGFPSFDMFKDFEDRGRQFNIAVEALVEAS